jgi:hypothetical protein
VRHRYAVGVAEPHAVNRPLGPTRVLCMLVLLMGIVAMHALMFAIGHDSATAMIAAGHGHSVSLHADDHPDAAVQSCPDGCGNHHAAFHACVFIMSITAFVVGLATLCWIGIARAQHATSKLRHRWLGRERAPPWTVLSLPELSMLRI